MVELDLPAFMQCDTEGCASRQPVRLILQGGGGFAFRPGLGGWQVLLPQGPAALAAPFKAHCPAHATKVQTVKVVGHG